MTRAEWRGGILAVVGIVNPMSLATAAILTAAIGVAPVASGSPASARSGPRTVTYNRDIAPIILDHCATCHHPEGAAPFSLVTYEQVKGRVSLIARATAEHIMPPWKPAPDSADFVGDRRLSAVQIHAIQAWVAGGAVEGDPADAAPTRTWHGGWQLGSPDLVVQMQPYILPAGGGDVLRNFVIPIPITTRRYVRGIEFLPSNRAVHHANMRLDETLASRRLDDDDPEPGYEGVTASSAHFPDGHFLGWTPGQVRPLGPDGFSWRLEPNSDLVV